MIDKIDSIEELKTFLTKAYWLEVKLEQADQWIASLKVKNDESRNVLFRISRDSEKHKSVLKNIISNIPEFNIEKSLEELPEYIKKQDNREKLDEEIFQDLVKNEQIAFDLYSKLNDLTDDNLIKKIWTGNNPIDYFNQIKWLIEQEREHIKLAKSLAIGNIERIM